LHRAMLNIYTPGSAILEHYSVEGTRVDTPEPAVWTGGPAVHLEAGKKVWSATVEIPPRADGAFTIGYRVPSAVRREGGRKVYRLVVQHQPKVQTEQLVLQIALPDGAHDIRAPGFVRTGTTLVWDRPLTQDLVLEVSWRS